MSKKIKDHFKWLKFEVPRQSAQNAFSAPFFYALGIYIGQGRLPTFGSPRQSINSFVWIQAIQTKDTGT